MTIPDRDRVRAMEGAVIDAQRGARTMVLLTEMNAEDTLGPDGPAAINWAAQNLLRDLEALDRTWQSLGLLSWIPPKAGTEPSGTATGTDAAHQPAQPTP